MTRFPIAALAVGLLAGGNVHAASTSSISATLNITLTDILLNGSTASDLFDYEADGGVEVYTDFSENFALGGAGTTSGSGSTSLNGGVVDPDFGGDPLQIGDTLTMALNSQATANTGFVSRDQREFAAFSFYNYTTDGGFGYQTLSFVFDYDVSYSTTLSNDVAGDQAGGTLNTLVTFDDDGNESMFDLFPDSTPDQISEFYFGTGTATPGDSRNGSFTLDLTGGYGYFTFETTAGTPTYISAVPLPAGVWLFVSGLLGLIPAARRRAAAI